MSLITETRRMYPMSNSALNYQQPITQQSYNPTGVVAPPQLNDYNNTPSPVTPNPNYGAGQPEFVYDPMTQTSIPTSVPNMGNQGQSNMPQQFVYDPMTGTSIPNPELSNTMGMQNQSALNMQGTSPIGNNIQLDALGRFNQTTGGQFSGYGQDTLNSWLTQMQQQGIDVNTMSPEAMQDSITAFNNNQLATTKFQPTALDWGKFALQGIGQAFSMYSNYKQLKMAKENFKEMKALNRANYRNQAKSMNAQYRNQMSGRGHIGLSVWLGIFRV